MKKYKILLLIFGSFILTGCNVTYNLEINDGDYKESIKILENDTFKFNTQIHGKDLISYKNAFLLRPRPVDKTVPFYSESSERLQGVTYYNIIDSSDDSKIELSTSNTFNIKTYEKSNVISYGYGDFSLIKNKDEIIISLSSFKKPFEQYPNLDNLIINITTSNKVLDNNANNVNGDTYTWKITRKNVEKQSIYLKFTEALVTKDDIINKQNKIAVGIMCGIFLSILVVVLLAFIRTKKNNIM